jgi:hypothetical protein
MLFCIHKVWFCSSIETVWDRPSLVCRHATLGGGRTAILDSANQNRCRQSCSGILSTNRKASRSGCSGRCGGGGGYGGIR